MVSKSDLTTSHPDWWSQFYGPIRNFGERVADFFSPISEAATTEHAYEINIELPGVSESDISVEVHDGRLTVTGEKKSKHEEKGKNFYFSERTFGQFRRAFQLPKDADTDKIKATHNDGVLTIQVAKIAPTTPKPKKIEVGRG